MPYDQMGSERGGRLCGATMAIWMPIGKRTYIACHARESAALERRSFAIVLIRGREFFCCNSVDFDQLVLV